MSQWDWEVLTAGAYNPDGSLFFPERLTEEFLQEKKRSLGSYIFSNQYLNEIVPADAQSFKRAWFRYYDKLPDIKNTYVFIDPALSEAATADYTGIIVVHVDVQGNWYVAYAQRHRITPTDLIHYIFKLNEVFQPNCIGIEAIAFQKALIYFLSEEMRRRNVHLPVTPIKYPNKNSKETRILSLVPRLEFGRILFAHGLTDLELELLQFPRGKHDDLIDALASIEYIASQPSQRPQVMDKPHSPADPRYEQWYRENLLSKRNNADDDDY